MSLNTVQTIFKKNGLQIFDVEEYATHGGSLRVFARRSDNKVSQVSNGVINILKTELESGIMSINFYKKFKERSNIIKNNLMSFLIKAYQDNKKVVAYGAAAKGSTLLNYAGIKSDLINYVVDRSLSKQNKYMPGSRIPIKDESFLRNDNPDYILILPWNLKNEIMTQLEDILPSKVKFIIAIPDLEII